MAQHYRCNLCQNEFPQKQVEVDHILPVVDPVNGFTTWDEYISRLFCGKENLQVVCRTCHRAKSALEKTKRK